jgi:hypothetical protein
MASTTCLLCTLVVLAAFFQAWGLSDSRRSFVIDDDRFVLDGQPMQIISGRWVSASGIESALAAGGVQCLLGAISLPSCRRAPFLQFQSCVLLRLLLARCMPTFPLPLPLPAAFTISVCTRRTGVTDWSAARPLDSMQYRCHHIQPGKQQLFIPFQSCLLG